MTNFISALLILCLHRVEATATQSLRRNELELQQFSTVSLLKRIYNSLRVYRPLGCSPYFVHVCPPVPLAMATSTETDCLTDFK